MKRGAKPYLKPYRFKHIFFLLVSLATINLSFGQETDTEQPRDSVKTGVALGKILLDNPDSIVSKYEYDPKIDRYVYIESVGDFNVNYPLFLTPEQYFELVEKESMKSYFKRKNRRIFRKKGGK